MTPTNSQTCELCNGTGYFKSNTAEFEGDCPNGCKNIFDEAIEITKQCVEGE